MIERNPPLPPLLQRGGWFSLSRRDGVGVIHIPWAEGSHVAAVRPSKQTPFVKVGRAVARDIVITPPCERVLRGSVGYRSHPLCKRGSRDSAGGFS